MSVLEATNFLKALLKKDVEQVQSWVISIFAEQEQVPEKFNWSGLAECAAFNAQRFAELNEYSSSSAWAQIAVLVYEFLAQKDPSSSEIYLSSLMPLRASMIVKFGSITGDPVLDIETIVNWFFDNLQISYQDALIKAAAWRQFISIKDLEERQKKFSLT